MMNMMSPTLTPMRTLICRSPGTSALRSRILRWISVAHDPVAGELHDPPLVPGDLCVDELLAVRLQRRRRSRLVGAHEPAVPDHIDREYGGKTLLDAFFSHRRWLLAMHRPAQLQWRSEEEESIAPGYAATCSVKLSYAIPGESRGTGVKVEAVIFSPIAGPIRN
jgi:hypothetical protein